MGEPVQVPRARREGQGAGRERDPGGGRADTLRAELRGKSFEEGEDLLRPPGGEAADRVEGGYAYVRDSMARLREVHAREWPPLKASSAGVLTNIVVSARALVAELGAWDAAEGAHLMETLKSPIAPGTINFMLTIGKALGVGLGPIASWVFGELRAAKDVQARNGKIDVHKEALLHLSSLTTEANLAIVDMFVARAAEDFKALGEIGGRIDASVVGPRSKAAESEADATEGAAGRFEQARRGGHEISEDRLGDFDAHAALEVAQADAKVTELLEDVRCYREALAQVERAGADATAKGWSLIAEAKDAYLREITGEAEGPAVTVTLALAHNPVAFGTLNEAGGRVAPADCWFTVSARHTIDAKVPESSVMRKHVQTKSVDALLAQDQSVMLRFEPGALEVLVKPDGGMERRGESGYYARFGAGMLEGDPGMSRKDLSRRDEARGGRVVDAVLALVRSTPIGALQRAAVRSI